MLAIRRRDNGHWVPPGGIMELAETPEHAVIREVQEETGVTVRPEVLTGVYKNMVIEVVSLVFRCRASGGRAHPTEEAREVEWLTLSQVEQRMTEAWAVLVFDSLRPGGPFVRVHDGTRLLPP